MLLKLIIFIYLSNYIIVGSKICPKINTPKFTSHFSSRTPYANVQNQKITKFDFSSESGNCKPIRSWLLLRHGIRNPSKKYINLMNTNLTNIKNEIIHNSQNVQLCTKAVNQLSKWSSKLNEDDEKLLSSGGYEELFWIGLRTSQRFPNLFSHAYSSKIFSFKFTKSQRTKESFRAFASGIFGVENLSNISYVELDKNDSLLRYYKYCKRWIKNVKENRNVFKEVDLWKMSEEMTNILDSVQQKFQLNQFTFDDLHLIYTVCSFETATTNHLSPWCYAFNLETIKLFEFYDDLKYYWKEGYGHELNYEQACPIVQDMYKRIHPKSEYSNSTFYFAHSGTILKLLAHLNLYRDDFKLTHKDFNRQRNWRTSYIDAFGSNLQFILYECTGKPTYSILTMHQERIVNLPGCPTTSHLCDFDIFTKILEKSIKNCRFNEICSIRHKDEL